MQEIVPGIYHWTAMHPRIKQRVSSYLVESAGVLVDPMPPEAGLAWFDEHRPQQIVLTNRHHYRDSGSFTERFGCPVLCSEAGLHEFDGGPDVQGFNPGRDIAPGVSTIEIGGICPDETALHAPAHGALAVADGVVNYGGLRFVPDDYLGDDPEAVKRGLREAYSRLLELEFDCLLLAHGAPLTGDARHALREFVKG